MSVNQTSGNCGSTQGTLTIQSTGPNTAQVSFRGYTDPAASFDPATCRVWNSNARVAVGAGSYDVTVASSGQLTGTAQGGAPFACQGQWSLSGG